MCTRGFPEIPRFGKPLARAFSLSKRSAARAVSLSRNSENASGNARRPNSSRYDDGTGLRYLRRRSLRDVARPKSNLHVIRYAGRTTDGGAGETTRVRKWGPICGGSSICLPRVRGNNPLEVPRGQAARPRRAPSMGSFYRRRLALYIVEFSSSGTHLNCSLDGVWGRYSCSQLLLEIIYHIEDEGKRKEERWETADNMSVVGIEFIRNALRAAPRR